MVVYKNWSDIRGRRFHWEFEKKKEKSRRKCENLLMEDEAEKVIRGAAELSSVVTLARGGFLCVDATKISAIERVLGRLTRVVAEDHTSVAVLARVLMAQRF